MPSFIFSEAQPEAEKNTQRVAAALAQKGYTGWDPAIDAQYSRQRTHAIRGSGPNSPLAGLRIVSNELGTVMGLLPFEMGMPRIRTPEVDGRKAEVSGVWTDDMSELLKLIRDVIAWLHETGVKVTYSVYNAEDRAMSDLLGLTLGLKSLPGKTVTYNSFLRQGRAIPWQIAIANEKTMTGTLQKLEERYGPSEPLVDLDLR